MQPSLAWNNILVYSLQVGLVVGLAAFLPGVFRLSAPRARLLYWHVLLAACLVLPLVRPWRQQVITGDVEVSTSAARIAAPVPSHRRIPWNAVPLVVLFAGAIARFGWLGMGMHRLRRYRVRATLLERQATCATYLSSEVSSPVTFGLRRPVILLPARFPELPRSMQEAIVCHERLHVERRDWLFTLCEEIVRALFWFHPAIWWLLGEIQLSREQAVDERVVELTGARDPYVDTLLAIAGAGMPLDLAPAPLFLRRRHLKTRVIGILKERKMSRKALIPALAASLTVMAAACWFITGAVRLAAAPQVIADAGGVSVNLNGAPLLHRAPVQYPASAVSSGIQGTVTVQVKLDANAEVADAAVLSGPDELRKPVIQSVLSWHFAKEAADSTRTITVDFVKPDRPAPTIAQGIGPRTGVSVDRTLKSIEIGGVSDEARSQLLAALPVRDGDLIDAAKAHAIQAAVKAFDSHLVVATVPAGEGAVSLRIGPVVAMDTSGPGQAPQKIRIGGNIQAAMIVSQQRPVYPPEAKAARIQGKVELGATIGPDGHVLDLQVLSGEPVLVQAALDAVKNWVYKPTLLNGNPVTVVTQIDVNFTLSQ